MFNFFRRSKKDVDAGPSREKKSKEKELKNSPGLNHKDMCKNKSLEKFESAPQGGIETSPNILTESELRENNEESAIVTGVEVITANPLINEMNIKETNTKLPYLNGMKKNESEIKNVRNVKPCGHGTIAIQPRIPTLSARRHSNSLTPPESPKTEMKHPYKKDDINDGQLKTDKNTISASMKIKLNHPSISSPSVQALTDSITENTTSASENNIDGDVKYVLEFFYRTLLFLILNPSTNFNTFDVNF